MAKSKKEIKNTEAEEITVDSIADENPESNSPESVWVKNAALLKKVEGRKDTVNGMLYKGELK